MSTAQTKFKETEIGPIPEEWSISNIADISSIITDYVANGSFASLKKHVKYSNSVDYAKLIRLVDFNRNFSGDFIYMNKEGYDFLKKSKLFGNEIIISNVGEYAGTVFKVPKINYPMTLGPNSVMLKTKHNDDFYFYWLRSIFGQESLQNIRSGSAIPKFNKTDLRKVLVPVPPNNEQKQISEILSSLDDKIELNRKINANLEKLAGSLFKQWFVDFEFPNEQGKPYKTSGGKMIDSELGEIPVDWKIIQATTVLDFIKGVEPGNKKYFDKFEEDMIPFYRVGDMFNGGQSNLFIDKNEYNYACCNYEDILISTDGTVGRVVTGIKGVHSGGIRKVVSLNKEIENSFIYFWLKSQYVQDKLEEYASSATTIAHASGAIKDFIIPYNKLIISNFGVILKPIFEQFQKNLKEINFLSNLRDSLLPRLMSGKIRVK